MGLLYLFTRAVELTLSSSILKVLRTCDRASSFTSLQSFIKNFLKMKIKKQLRYKLRMMYFKVLKPEVAFSCIYRFILSLEHQTEQKDKPSVVLYSENHKTHANSLCGKES
jgi:predicted phosphatase